jgi:hypothetical protein
LYFDIGKMFVYPVQDLGDTGAIHETGVNAKSFVKGF